MEKKRSKKKIIIILIIIVIVIVVAITAYYFMSGKGSMFSFMSPDFSAGAGAMNKVAAAGNANTFENTKLNPFENLS